MTAALPAFFYDNRLADATPVASSTYTGNYAAANINDMRPYTWHKFNALPGTYTVDCGLAKAADYALIYGHDLFTNNCYVEVRGSTDNFATSDVLVAYATPTSDAPFLISFSTVSYRYWRYSFFPHKNLLTYSEQFDNTIWIKESAVVTANATTAPDGTATADKAVITTRIYCFDNTGVLGTKVFSVYAKAEVGNVLSISPAGVVSIVGGSTITINLTTGAIVSAHVSPNVVVTAAANGFWRISILANVTVASGNTTYWQFGAITGCYLWGAQLESNSAVQSYIPTTSAAVSVPSSPQPSTAIAMIGSRFSMPIQMPYGFDPMGRASQLQANNNENGYPLGKIIDYDKWMQTLNFNGVNQAWLRSTFLPAWNASLRGSPSVFGWNTGDYPAELYLVGTSGTFKTSHDLPTTANLSFDINGIVT